MSQKAFQLTHDHRINYDFRAQPLNSALSKLHFQDTLSVFALQ